MLSLKTKEMKFFRRNEEILEDRRVESIENKFRNTDVIRIIIYHEWRIP